MFNVGDLIIYGGTGVCRVKDITHPDFGMPEDRLYYILEPVYQAGTIYAPVDNGKVYMRPVISEEEANELIDRYIYFYNHERIQTKTGVAPLTLRHSA